MNLTLCCRKFECYLMSYQVHFYCIGVTIIVKDNMVFKVWMENAMEK